MSEFKRAKPKPVPENWQELGKIYAQEREAYMKSEEYEKLKDPRKEKIVGRSENSTGHVQPGAVYIVPTDIELYSYFKTVINTPDVAKHYFNSSIHEVVANGEILGRDYIDLALRRYFLEWWLRSYTDYPIFTLKNVYRTIDAIIDGALVQHLNGESVQESIRIINLNKQHHNKRALIYMERFGGTA